MITSCRRVLIFEGRWDAYLLVFWLTGSVPSKNLFLLALRILLVQIHDLFRAQ